MDTILLVIRELTNEKRIILETNWECAIGIKPLIMLSVLRYADSNYPFGIFKLYFSPFRA